MSCVWLLNLRFEESNYDATINASNQRRAKGRTEKREKLELMFNSRDVTAGIG